MRPSPPPPSLDDFPSSPSSAWSCTDSRSPSSTTQDHLSPTTPDSLIADEFTHAPHKSSITHFLPQSSVPSDTSFLSEDDISKVQVFLRNKGRWLESSPPLRPHIAPRVTPALQDSPGDEFSWEATHSALVDLNELPDPSRCSLLIHEVSLLVGLAADDDHLAPNDDYPLVPESRRVPDILPLSLTPTKSLASRKHRNACLPQPTKTNVPVHSSTTPISPCINPRLHDEKPLPLTPSDLVTPIARHKSADAARPSLYPRRRQGQVFHIEDNAPRRNAVILDETFIHPRNPPPKPTPNPSANRCSSLDRLETSLLKLEAHAPRHHRKSQSEGRSVDHVALRKDKRPSLPPPRRLKKQQSNREITPLNTSRLVTGCHLSGPPPLVLRPIPHREYVVPPVCPTVPLDDDYGEEDHTPGSFMDMDIPQAVSKRQASFRQVKSKEKMKSLVSVAKRVSRGVIAWGKNLAGSTKPPVAEQETTAIRSVRA